MNYGFMIDTFLIGNLPIGFSLKIISNEPLPLFLVQRVYCSQKLSALLLCKNLRHAILYGYFRVMFF